MATLFAVGGIDRMSSTPIVSTRPAVGDPMPNLTLQGLDGKPFGLERLRGQRALLFMWASW